MSACAMLRSMSSISMVVFLPGCFSTEDNGSLLNDGTEVIHNKLSVEERSDGWELLFDGVSLDQWRGYGRDDMPETWIAQDGEMMLQTAGGNMDGGDVEFIAVTSDNVLQVRLVGACSSCPSSTMTLAMGIERTIMEQFPEIMGVEQV